MHPLTEYLIGLGRDHVEEIRCLGAVVLFGVIVVAANLALRRA